MSCYIYLVGAFKCKKNMAAMKWYSISCTFEIELYDEARISIYRVHVAI